MNLEEMIIFYLFWILVLWLMLEVLMGWGSLVWCLMEVWVKIDLIDQFYIYIYIWRHMAYWFGDIFGLIFSRKKTKKRCYQTLEYSPLIEFFFFLLFVV